MFTLGQAGGAQLSAIAREAQTHTWSRPTYLNALDNLSIQFEISYDFILFYMW